MSTQQKKYLLPFILVTCLFFLWAFLHNINSVLIPHLKKACELTDAQSAFIDSAVSLAYFLVALPAGWFIHKFGYKNGIILGLLLFAAGFLLFIPAASSREYSFFLIALFIGASGATILETVANPYVTKLGDEKSAAFRINLAQSFNGVGAFIAPIIGGTFILSGVEYTKEQVVAMKANGSYAAYLQEEASAVKIPYLILGIVVLVLLVIIFFTKLPEIKENEKESESKPGPSFSFSVLRHKHLLWSVIAQFFYVGAQVCIGSFFIRYSKYVNNIAEKDAAIMWGSIAMVGFMAGRFVGTFLMKEIKPPKLLMLFAVVNVLLLALAINSKGALAVYLLMATPFFMSIMFPTIFAMGISGLGEETKIASSLIVMAIIGGAVFPVIMGKISDANAGNIQLAYIVPAICFVVIAGYAYKFRNLFTEKTVSSH
jgi:FHS family L-fucose permease-like MFS transporter